MNHRMLPPSLPGPEKPNLLPLPQTSTSTAPFRFLSLPKEIRLMIYENLLPSTSHHTIPLQDSPKHRIPLDSSPHSLTLVTTTLPGISLPATNHQIYYEASRILSPYLHTISVTPPTIIIPAAHLLGLIDTHDSLALPTTFWTSFLHHISPPRKPRTTRSIQRYRRGTITSSKLRNKLSLADITPSTNDDTKTLEAVTSFLLRTIKYIDMKPDTAMYTSPPLTLLIDISQSFTGTPVTATTSRPRILAYKIFFPRTVAPQRTTSGFCDAEWLLHRVVYHAARAYDRRIGLSLSIKVSFLDGEVGVVEGWKGGWRA